MVGPGCSAINSAGSVSSPACPTNCERMSGMGACARVVPTATRIATQREDTGTAKRPHKPRPGRDRQRCTRVPTAGRQVKRNWLFTSSATARFLESSWHTRCTPFAIQPLPRR